MFKQLLRMTITLQLFVPGLCAADIDSWRNRASSYIEVTQNDIAAEISLGRAITARIFGKYIACNNPDLIKYVSLVGNTLTQNINRPELEFYFMILDSDEVNSYAVPGGYIFITRGALQLMEDEAELAGVLAYEIAHIAQNHVVKILKLKNSSKPSDLAKLISGPAGAISGALVATTNPAPVIQHSEVVIESGLDLIYNDAYTNENKAQASEAAVFINSLSGYDPSGLASYLARINHALESTPEMSGDSTQELVTRISVMAKIISEENFDGLVFSKNTARFLESTKSLR